MNPERRHVKIRYISIVKKWRVYIMGPRGSYGIKDFDTFNDAVLALNDGSIREMFQSAFEAPTRELLDLLDQQE